MRPDVLHPLFAEVEALKGVGPGVAKGLARLGLSRAVDLAYHLPTGTIDRISAPFASAAMLGRIVILPLTPVEARSSAGRGPTRIYARDADDNTITLTFFNNPGWAKKMLPLHETRIVSGKLEAYGDEWQIVHPEVMETGAEPPLSEPIYPLTEGIANRRMRELALAALERAPDLAEWIEPSLLAREGWRPWRASLAEAHSEPLALF